MGAVTVSAGGLGIGNGMHGIRSTAAPGLAHDHALAPDSRSAVDAQVTG